LKEHCTTAGDDAAGGKAQYDTVVLDAPPVSAAPPRHQLVEHMSGIDAYAPAERNIQILKRDRQPMRAL